MPNKDREQAKEYWRTRAACLRAGYAASGLNAHGRPKVRASRPPRRQEMSDEEMDKRAALWLEQQDADRD